MTTSGRVTGGDVAWERGCTKLRSPGNGSACWARQPTGDRLELGGCEGVLAVVLARDGGRVQIV